MKKSLLVVGALLVLPAVALASPKLMLTYGGTGTTPTTDTTTTVIPAPGGTGTGLNFWLNVVMLDDEGYVGAFGAGLDVNAAGTNKLKYMSAVESSYTYFDEELGEDVTMSYWDRVASISSTTTGYVGQRSTDGNNTLVNIGLYSKTSENPAAGAFPIVESIKVRLYDLNPTNPIVVSFADPGAGLNWGCLAASAPVGQPIPGGSFASLGSFTILPEPVSLVLLAVGGLFLRRRVA